MPGEDAVDSVRRASRSKQQAARAASSRGSTSDFMYLLPMLLCGISQRRPSACGLGHDYILRAAVSSHMRCPAVAVHAVDP